MPKSYTIENKSYSLSDLLSNAKLVMKDSSLSDFYRGAWAFMAEWLSAEDAVQLQSSGSTGEPKRMRMPKHFMRNSALMTLDFFGLKQGDTVLCCMSADYIAGKMMIVRALEGGLNLLFSEPKANLLKNVDSSIDFVAMVPLQLENVLRDNSSDLMKVKHLLLGGAAVSPDLEEKIQHLDCKVWHSYGMTETVSHVAIRRLNGDKRQAFYTAMPQVKLSLDERQCLQIEAPHLCAEFIVTNDIVALDENGTFRFLGRYDNVINSGGVKVSPELVEQKLATSIAERFIISSEADERLGQKVILIIEGRPRDTAALMENLKSLLSPYECPKEIRFVRAFEETGSGKIKRPIHRY